MQVSIFPQAKALPSKEEKGKEAKYTSKPYKPVNVEFNTEDDLIDIITNNCWSPSIFEGFRKQSNFVQTDLMVLDIDSGMRIEEAEQIVIDNDFSALCLPSTSHTDEEHRFRLIFPLARAIRGVDVFKKTMEKIAEHFPADPSCIGDTARMFFGCKFTDGFWIENTLLEPVEPEIAPESVFDREAYRDSIEVLEDVEDVVRALYGEGKDKIPEQVDFFIREAHTGLEGLWHNSFNSFVFTLSLQGVSFEKIAQVAEQLAPEPLDDHDEYLLNRAFRDGQEKRVEENILDKKRNRSYTRRSRRRSRRERRR